MPRKPRDLKPNYCYHITTRCNNREFKLIRHDYLLDPLVMDVQLESGIKNSFQDDVAEETCQVFVDKKQQTVTVP